MIGRLARGQEGMVMGLAIIMIVLVGVMGAGLLTVVVTDLQAVVEVNRGQQAFELAEAGIEVAKAHLAEGSSPSDWSAAELHVDGMGENTVGVNIEYGDGAFEATSTGQYGETKRKIEAVFSVEDGQPELLSWRELYE